jgi:hypothetical protein
VIVAVAVVLLMKSPRDDVIGVIAMRDHLVSAFFAVSVRGLVTRRLLFSAAA